MGDYEALLSAYNRREAAREQLIVELRGSNKALRELVAILKGSIEHYKAMHADDRKHIELLKEMVELLKSDGDEWKCGAEQ